MEVTGVVQRIRDQGYKLTPQRLAVIEALAASHAHPTAYELFEQVSRRYPMMGLATVYKTLDLLKEIGEIVETGFGVGGARYEANLRPHVNLVCRVCGKVTDLEADLDEPISHEHLTPSWVANVAEKAGFTVQGGHIEYFGVCAPCQHRMAAPGAASTRDK